MNGPLTLLGYAVAVTRLLVLGLWFYLWRAARRRDPAEVERHRRLHINQIGRLADGRVIELLDSPNDAAPDGPPHLIVYRYQVRGVEYQAAQDITFLGPDASSINLRRVASGQPIRVKHDPHNPSNSIILCEVWSGL